MGLKEKILAQEDLKDGIFVISGNINEEMANLMIAKMLYFESECKKDITLYIDSIGGTIVDGVAIYDTMKFIKNDINVILFGDTCGISLLIATAGKTRIAYSNVKLGFGVFYKREDIEYDEKNEENIKKIKDKICDLISINTGIPFNEMKRLMDSGKVMDVKEACDIGLIDKVEKVKEF